MFKVAFYYIENDSLMCKEVLLNEVDLRRIPRSRIMYIIVEDQYHNVLLVFLMKGRVLKASRQVISHGKILKRYDNCLIVCGKNWASTISHLNANIYTIPPYRMNFCIRALRDYKGSEYRELQKRVRVYEQEEKNRLFYYV